MRVQMKPAGVIIANLGIQPNGPAHKFFTNECYKAMDKYVPYSGKSGRLHLRENVSMTTEGNAIIYNMPYASYQYYGIREDGTHKVVNYTTPGTGTYWDKKMWTAHQDDIVRKVQVYVNTHGGNNEF